MKARPKKDRSGQRMVSHLVTVAVAGDFAALAKIRGIGKSKLFAALVREEMSREWRLPK